MTERPSESNSEGLNFNVGTHNNKYQLLYFEICPYRGKDWRTDANIQL